jgi:hypothetical protein
LQRPLTGTAAAQDNSRRTSVSVSVAPPFATNVVFAGKINAPSVSSARCKSNPNNVLGFPSERSSITPSRFSKKPIKQDRTLVGVFRTELPPPNTAKPTRAPFARDTPRVQSRSTHTVRAPFSTNTPRPGSAPRPVQAKAPFHTSTPRAATPPSSYRSHAPFHCNTPRDAVSKRQQSVVPPFA